ncbi:MAG: helix-turn-helix domain-containing protein, partial [Gammaproteobacteria bacterium]|nr:helix-turn-helix domain-containing protein [Gammaproteobacteria bacterium]
MNIFNKDQPFKFGKAVFPNGGRYGPVTHEHLDITVILQGEATVVIDEAEHRCVAGYAVFAYSEQRYEMIFPKGTGHYVRWCHTGELVMPQQYKTWLKSVPHCIPTSKLVSWLIDEGIALGHGEGVSLDRLRNSMGEAVFNDYFYRANLEEEDSRYPRAVARAKRYIDNNFASHCDLDKIADFANLNPRYLLRLFKQHIGITPTRYLWRLRAEKGVYLLHQSKLSVYQIAEQCGFQSAHHFSRHIKEQYGLPPTNLRQATKNRNPFEFNRDVP